MMRLSLWCTTGNRQYFGIFMERSSITFISHSIFTAKHGQVERGDFCVP